MEEAQSDPLALSDQEKTSSLGSQTSSMLCCVDNNKVRDNIFKLGCSNSTEVCFGFAISRLAVFYYDLLRYKSEIQIPDIPFFRRLKL